MADKKTTDNQKHPDYEYVVFKDTGSDLSILTRSTIKSEETTKWEDGEEYPLVKIEISSKSHPFYTGKQRIVDTENKVKAFEKKTQAVNKQAVKAKKEKKAKRRAKVQEIKAGKSLTLKDMLKQMQ